MKERGEEGLKRDIKPKLWVGRGRRGSSGKRCRLEERHPYWEHFLFPYNRRHNMATMYSLCDNSGTGPILGSLEEGGTEKEERKV